MQLNFKLQVRLGVEGSVSFTSSLAVADLYQLISVNTSNISSSIVANWVMVKKWKFGMNLL